MMTVVAIDSTEYYDHMASTEYYSDGGEPSGVWSQGIEQLGVQSGGKVNSEDMKKIMSGFDLKDKKLVQSAGTDKHRLGLDCTFSAPKSVSVIWANAEPDLREKISQMQARAVDNAMEFLRENATARRGKNGTIHETPKNLIYAKFEHCNTRANDPQLHNHVVVSNSCIREDGTTGTLENSNFFKLAKHAGAIYRAALARELKTEGFKIEADKDNDKGLMWQVAGVDKELEKHFSKRSETIQKIAQETGAKSAKALQFITLKTREKKEEVNRTVLFKNWQEESQERGFNAQTIEGLKQAQAVAFEMPTNAALFTQLTENESTFSREAVALKFAELSQYHDIDIKEETEAFLESDECVHLVQNCKDKNGVDYVKSVFTSKEMHDLERGIIDKAEARSADTSHILDAQLVQNIIKKAELKNGFTFKDEQRQAIQNLTAEAGGISIFSGRAGAGKTTSLTPVVAAYQAAGYTVYGATISAKAAQVLEHETGLKTHTIAQTLIDLDSGKMTLNSKSLLVVDEIGMVGSREFSRLQNHLDNAGAKMIASGDAQQLQSISAGGVLRALQTHTTLKTSELKDITRQKNEEQRTASQLFADGKAAEALAIYEENGQIKTDKYRNQVAERLAGDYVKDTSEASQKVVLAATRADAFMLNNMIREKLIEKGDIDGYGVGFENYDKESLIVAKGDRIIFKKNDKKQGIQNNLTGTVIEASQQGKNALLKIRDDAGKTHLINTEKYNEILHGHAITTHASQGSTVQNSYIFFNKNASNQELGYVAMTRHKTNAAIYCTHVDREALAVKFGTENLKGTTLDFQVKEKAPAQAQSVQIQTPSMVVNHAQAAPPPPMRSFAAQAPAPSQPAQPQQASSGNEYISAAMASLQRTISALDEQYQSDEAARAKARIENGHFQAAHGNHAAAEIELG